MSQDELTPSAGQQHDDLRLRAGKLYELLEGELLPLIDAYLRKRPYLGRRLDAADVLARTILRLVPHFDDLFRDAKLQRLPYAFTVAKNVCRSLLRAAVRYSAFAGETAYHDQALENLEREEWYGGLIEALSPEDFRVFCLKYVDGQKCAEIAKLLGQQEGTIRVRLTRMRARLKARLGAPPPYVEPPT